MNERLTIQDLIDLLAAKHGMTKKDAEAFVKEFFQLIEEALVNEQYVKIKGLGTFKLIEVDSRESVNINTRERFEIKGHTKVSFSPDTNLRDIINKPFAHFETVVLNDDTVLADTKILDESEVEENEKVEEKDQNDENNSGDVTEEQSKEDIIEHSDKEIKNKVEFTTEEIIAQELQKANLKPIIKPESSVDNPQKEKSAVPFLITIIIIVLLFCGSAILFIYYPDLFSSSDKTDMPVATQPVQFEKHLSDSIREKDTIVNVKPTEIKEKIQPQVVIEKESEPVVQQNNKLKQKPSNPVYSDSETYSISGTKTTHTIKEGETLTKVSLKYYGTKALWPYIVKHNIGIIKNPDNVPYGTNIKIPELTKK